MEAVKEKLVVENMRLAGYMMKRYSNTGIEWEDLQSLCYLGMVKAAAKFDESRGMAFSTLAGVCMENEVLRVMRSKKSLKRSFATVSFETVVYDNGDDLPLKLEDILPAEDTDQSRFEEANLIASIRNSNRLSDAERECILLWLSGNRQDVIGKKTGYSQSYVSRLIKSGARKLYAGNYL